MLPRSAALATVALLAALGLSGCVAIKTESSSTRAPGVVTISLSVCASQRAAGSNCIPSPDATPGQVVNTQEGDNGTDALTGTAQNPLKGQLLVGFRVPAGTVAPGQFTSVTGEQFNQSASYTQALRAAIPLPTGFDWVGYISSSVTLTGGAPLSSLDVEFGLPSASDGSPFTGPFLWRAIIGQVGVGVDPNPSTCTASATDCFDSPPAADLGTHLQQNVSDFRVMAGTGATVAPGQAATLSFTVRYIDNATPKFGPRSFDLSGSSTLPGNPKVTPSSVTLGNVADGTTRAVTAAVTVPAGTAPGSYPVTLTATDSSSGVQRTSKATLNVVDKTPPTISLGSPTNGQVVTQGQQIAAAYSCADEPNGSGLASCTGTVPDGAPIDTTSPGQKTFTVTAADKATPPNTATLTHTYTVQTPPVVVAKAPPQINATLVFLFAAARQTTKFTSLAVKGVPKGATVTVTCKGKGCPVHKVKGKRRAVSLTKRHAAGSVTLKPWVKRQLKVGTVLTVSVTKAGSIGMIKTLTIRPKAAPKVRTTCLKPGAKRASACS